MTTPTKQRKKHNFKLCKERPDLCEKWGCKCSCHPKTSMEENWKKVLREKADYDPAELGLDWDIEDVIKYISKLLKANDKKWINEIKGLKKGQTEYGARKEIVEKGFTGYGYKEQRACIRARIHGFNQALNSLLERKTDEIR